VRFLAILAKLVKNPLKYTAIICDFERFWAILATFVKNP